METWTDHNGKVWRTPTILGRLKFRIPCHAALRAFVFWRDGYACVQCHAKVESVPNSYDGRNTLGVPGEKIYLVMDHKVSRRNGGEHHPDNLQTMCGSCNAAKAGLVDSKGV